LDCIVLNDWTVLINGKGSGRNRSWHILVPRHLPKENEETHAVPFKSDSYRIGDALELESLALWESLLSTVLPLCAAKKCELTWKCSNFTGNCCWLVFFFVLILYLYEQFNVSVIFISHIEVQLMWHLEIFVINSFRTCIVSVMLLLGWN
jgi:hypothetical protein